MILVHPKTASRRKWLVTCDVHGEITGTGQTTAGYALQAAITHRRDCVGHIASIQRGPGRRPWSVTYWQGGYPRDDAAAKTYWKGYRPDDAAVIAHTRSLPAAIRKAHEVAAVDA